MMTKQKIFEELITYQRARLLKEGQRLVPNLTTDDILQPNDFPTLERDPEFRYEEGILAGILAAQAALADKF